MQSTDTNQLPGGEFGTVREAPAGRAFLSGGGAVGAMMLAHDWSTSPLGPPEAWPPSLRTVVGLMLGSKFPMFVAWGAELGFLYNDAYAGILAGKHPDALGRRFHDVWSEIWPDILPLIEGAMAGESAYRENWRLFMNRTGQFEHAWFTFSYSPVRDENGAIGGMFCAVTETSATVQAEAALRESEARFRRTADTAPALLWVTDAQNRCIYLSRSWYEFTGQTPEEAEGFGWLDAAHPDDRARASATFMAAAERREPFRLEYRLLRRDGSYRWAIDAGRPHFAETAEYLGYVGSVIDIHERKEAEAALGRHRAELEQLVETRTAALLREVEERRRAEEALRQGEKLQAIGQLTGGIAHDFNNIMQVVTSGAALLQMPHLDEAKRLAILDGLKKAGRNAKELTDRLLSFARKQTLQPEAFDLNARLQGMSELLRHTLGSRIEVRIDFATDLAMAMADPSQLEVAVLNLAANARDAMMPEGGTLILTSRTVQLGATTERSAGAYVALAISDTGQGMPPAVMARAFEPFFTTKGPEKGTGLGLAQVHGFAKQSGGDIEIASTPGKGTTITLLLPCATPDMRGAAPARAQTTGGAVQRAAGKTVLVVDDNGEVATFAASMLEGLGYSTRIAANAAAALAVLEGGGPVDAVFSDVVMPGEMDGIAFARMVRRRHPGIALVLATGYSEAMGQAGNRALAEVLGKPYRLHDLALALERALAAAERRAGLA
jgi:PAS domain S-box-containing protein